MKNLTIFNTLQLVLFSSALFALGCGGGQTLGDPDLSPEGLSRSVFHAVTLVSMVEKGDKDTERPSYLVAGEHAYVIPPALRDSLKGVEPGSVISCPAKLYTAWQRVEPGSESLLKENMKAPVTESDVLRFRYPQAAEDSPHIGFNGRVCLVQTMLPDRPMQDRFIPETSDTAYTAVKTAQQR